MTNANEETDEPQQRDGPPKRKYRTRLEIDPRIVVAGRVLDHVRHSYEPAMSLNGIGDRAKLTKEGVRQILMGGKDPLLPSMLSICAALDVDLGLLVTRIDEAMPDINDHRIPKIAGKSRLAIGTKPASYETIRHRLSKVFRLAFEPMKLRAGKDAIEAVIGSSRQSAYDLIGSKQEQEAQRYRPVKLGTLWAISDGLGISLGRLLSELSRPTADPKRALARARLAQ